MNLSEEQKRQVQAWIESGLSLSQVQQSIQDTFKLSLTYRDVRFLVDDLGLAVKEKNPTTPAAAENTAPATTPIAPAGGVQVSVDAITRPGAAISGQVTFSDGTQAGWQLDGYGRIGIIPPHKGYTPPQADLAEFQSQIQKELQRIGY